MREFGAVAASPGSLLSRPRRRGASSAALVLLLLAAGDLLGGGPTGTRKRRPLPDEFGRVVMDNLSEKGKVAPVVFEHWSHRMRFTCRVCHVDIGFAMQANATMVREEDNRRGYFCGSCHNGKLAFGPQAKDPYGKDDPSCERCHSQGTGGTQAGAFEKAVAGFPKGRFGNGVDWDVAEAQGKLRPVDTVPGVSVSRKPLQIPPDADIEAKVASLPDITFSHRKHTTWSGCELCHPDVFSIKKGSTQYTMEEIFAGRYCGLCHGTVAFPTIDCQRCHTKPVTK